MAPQSRSAGFSIARCDGQRLAHSSGKRIQRETEPRTKEPLPTLPDWPVVVQLIAETPIWFACIHGNHFSTLWSSPGLSPTNGAALWVERWSDGNASRSCQSEGDMHASCSKSSTYCVLVGI